MSEVYALDDLRVRFGQAEILRGLSLTFGEAALIAIVGPNGAGKSTMMSVLSGVLNPYEGSCRFRGREVSAWNKRQFAKQMSFVPQTVRLEFPFTAEQVVYMGRTPYCNGLFESPNDGKVVRRAMETTDSWQFADRDFRALSGGERQRVVLAGALAQEPEVLLLDEPTSYLDLKHQVRTYDLLRRLAREGLTVLAVTHDLNLAASYADRIVVLSNGAVAADGTVEEVLREKLLHDVFEVRAEIREGPRGRPWVFYEEAEGYPDGHKGASGSGEAGGSKEADAP